MTGPYTTITVDEYTHLANVVLALREKVQKARELLEKDEKGEALELLRRDIPETRNAV